jgi:hypothetical protein
VRGWGVGLVLFLTIGACIHTQEMPLAPNVVRLDTQASGLLFVGQASSKTLRRAAEITLQKGYTHFRLDDAQVSQGTQVAGMYSSGQATGSGTASATRVGDTTYVQGTSAATGSAISTPIYRPTANVGVTVYMFKANDPQAQGAFDAAEVLRSKTD